MKTYLLILYLAGGSPAYDDSLTGEACHMLAESMKEGGRIVVDGTLDLIIVTAECREIEEKGI